MSTGTDQGGGHGTNTCPGCGAPISPNAPEGLCLECVVLLAKDYSEADNPADRDYERESLGEVGDYEILERVAAGGMGVVYKARQKSLNRLVALKLISEGKFAGHTDRERFLFEARAAGELDHPNIVPVYEVGEDNGQYYFSMRLVTGGDLTERLSSLFVAGGGGKGDDTMVIAGARERLVTMVKLLVKVARAVHYAHTEGILHRDLKPANILIDKRNEPQITDFGLAKRVHEASDLTLSGQVLGSPAYMAPEQAEGLEELTPAADVYALGVILYQCLTGNVPFHGGSPLAILQQTLTREPKSPRRLHPRVDRDLETICLRCLEKVPQKRYASAATFADELERWLDGRPILSKPAGPGKRLVKWARRKPAIAALIALFVVAVATVTVMVRQHGASESRNRLAAYAMDIKYADEVLRKGGGDLSKARDRLALYAAPAYEEIRGIEWRLLWRASQEPPYINAIRVGDSPVFQLATNPQSREHLVVQMEDGSLRTGKVADTTFGGAEKATPWNSPEFTFVGGGSFLLAEHPQRGLYLRSANLEDKWSLLPANLPPARGFFAVAPGPEPSFCVTASGDSGAPIQISNVRDGRPLATFNSKSTDGRLHALAISSNVKPTRELSDKWYLAFSYLDWIRIGTWDTSGVASWSDHTFPKKAGIVTALVFTPKRELLIAGDQTGMVSIYNWRVGKLIGVRQLDTAVTALHCFAAIDDQYWIAAGGKNGQFVVWDVVSTGFPKIGIDLAEPVTASADGSVLWGTSDAGDAIVAMRNGFVTSELAAIPPGESLLGVHPIDGDPDRLAAITRTAKNGGLQLYHLSSGRPLLWVAVLENSEGLGTLHAQTAIRTRWLAVADKRWCAWDLRTGKTLAHRPLPFDPSRARAVVLDAPSNSILIGGQDGSLRRLPLDSGSTSMIDFPAFPSKAVPPPAEGLALSPDGKTLATYHVDGHLRLWQASTGKPLMTLVARPWRAVCFSADGSTLVANEEGAKVFVWKAPLEVTNDP